MPTGLRLAGASRAFAPLNGSKTCFGMTQAVPPKVWNQAGVGDL